MTYKIGMRNIKTTLAVFIIIVIYEVFGFRYPFYAVTAAIISMESSIINSFKVGRNRLMGTVLGAFVGLCFALISPGNAILSTVGVMVIIYICNLLHWNKSIIIAAIVFISIMFNIGEGQTLEYSLDRIIDTSIGIIIGLGINFSIAPYNFERSIEEQLLSIKKDIRQLIQESICSPLLDKENHNLNSMNCCGAMEETLKSLNTSLTHLKDELAEYTSEIRFKKTNEQRVEEVISTIEILKEIYAHLKVIAPIIEGRQISENNIVTLENLNFNIRRDHEIYTAKNLDNIYNYHLEIILENTELLEFPKRDSV